MTGSGDADRGDPVVRHDRCGSVVPPPRRLRPRHHGARGAVDHSPFVTGFLLRRRCAARVVVRWPDHPGQLDPDPGRGRAVHRRRAQPGGAVADPARLRHSVGGAGRRARLRRGPGPVRRRDRPGDRRPGRDADRERPGLASTSSSTTARSRSSTTSTTSSTRPRTTSPAATSTQQVFGGVLGVGLAVLGVLANAFIVLVLTLYFLASLDTIKATFYRPRARQPSRAGQRPR